MEELIFLTPALMYLGNYILQHCFAFELSYKRSRKFGFCLILKIKCNPKH